MDNVERAIKSLEWLKDRLDRVSATLDSNAVSLTIGLLKKLKWKSLEKELPEEKKSVLMWLDHKRGGFAVVAHVEDDGSIWWWGYGGRRFLTDPSGVYWMDITEP